MELESGTEEITEGELLAMQDEQTKRNIMVAMPAKVEAVTISSTAQTVDVTPQLNRSLPDGQGAYVSEALPKLKGVPIGLMRGGGAFCSLPIAVGDYGMLICCDRNLAQWRATGAQGDPGDLGLHTLDGAFFLPCVAPDANALQNADPNNVVIGFDATPAARIVIKPSGEIDAGSAATNFVAMADKVKAWLTAFNSAVSGWTPVPNDGGAALKTALGTLIGGSPTTSVGSSNLKAND